MKVYYPIVTSCGKVLNTAPAWHWTLERQLHALGLISKFQIIFLHACIQVPTSLLIWGDAGQLCMSPSHLKNEQIMFTLKVHKNSLYLIQKSGANDHSSLSVSRAWQEMGNLNGNSQS